MKINLNQTSNIIICWSLGLHSWIQAIMQPGFLLFSSKENHIYAFQKKVIKLINRGYFGNYAGFRPHFCKSLSQRKEAFHELPLLKIYRIQISIHINHYFVSKMEHSKKECYFIKEEMNMENVNILDRITRTTLVNAIGGTKVIDIMSKLRSFVEEDEISQMHSITGVIEIEAGSEFLAGDLFLIQTRGTIADADTSEDADGTDATKTFDEMTSDEYVAKKLGIFRTIDRANATSSVRCAFSYRPSKADKKAFRNDSSSTTNLNTVICARVITANGALGAHNILINYNMKYSVSARKPFDLLLS